MFRLTKLLNPFVAKKRETLSDRRSNSALAHSQQSKSSDSDSETFTESEISKKHEASEEASEKPINPGSTKQEMNQRDRLIGTEIL